MSLRDSIKPIHDRAEHHPLAQAMITGGIAAEVYVDLLASLLIVYGDLESKARKEGLLAELAGVSRYQLMLEDLVELISDNGLGASGYESFIDDYCDHIWKQDNEGVLAHLYVHHMGDLFGGQILKNKLPGKCRRYDFTDRDDLITKIRASLTDSEKAKQEAIHAFEFVISLYDKVAAKHNIH